MKTRNRKRIVFFWFTCQVIAFSLLFSPTLPGRAQQPQTGTDTGILAIDGAGAFANLAMDQFLMGPGEPLAGPVQSNSDCAGLTPADLRRGGLATMMCYLHCVKIGEINSMSDSELWACINAVNGQPANTVPPVPTLTKVSISTPTPVFTKVIISPSRQVFTKVSSSTPTPVFTKTVISTPTPESTEEDISTLTPEIAEEVIFSPTPGPVDSCLVDPLNAPGCMETPIINPGVAAVISVFATLAIILVSLAGSAATTAGEAAAVVGAAIGEAVTGAATDGATDGATPNQILDIIQNNPQLNGGPKDNSSTDFDGGNGPGSCSKTGLPNYWVNTANLNLYIVDTVYSYQGLGPGITLRLSYNSAPGNPGMFGRNWRFSYDSVIQQLPDRFLLWKGSGQRLSFRSGARRGGQDPNTPQEAVSLEGGRDRLFDYGAFLLLVESESRLRYTYDKSPRTAWARLSAIIDQNENAVRLAYNPDGTLHSVTDAAGRFTSFIYDATYRCVGFFLPDGRQAKYAYDGQGNLTQAVDLLGTIACYEYDQRNSLARMIVGHDQKTTTFTYQDRGQGQYLAGVTDAGGNITRYELLSVAPRQVRVTDPEGQPTSYYSTPQGHTERVMDPLGNTVTTGYANGLPVSFTNPNGQTAYLEYDAQGNRVRMIDALGSAWASTYDEYGRRTSETDPLGARWQYAYDGRGNLVRTVSPEGRTLSVEVDAKGQVISIGDGANQRVRFSYDAFGKVVSRSEPTGSTAQMTYDSAGMRLAAYTDARGATTHYEYDPNDRLTRSVYPDGSSRSFAYDCCAGVSAVDENGNRASYRRDPMLRIVEQQDAAGGGFLFSYDANDRPLKLVDALGHATTFHYDAAGRRVQEVNSLGQITQARFDPNGNLVALTNELGKTTSFEYNAANQLVRSTDPLGQAMAIRRDALGRPLEISGARGSRVGMIYSPDGYLTAKTYDGARVAAYEYDAAGNISHLQDSSGDHIFSYAPAGQVSAIQYPDRTKIAIAYDEIRNPSRIVYPGNLEVRYTYNGRGRLAKLAWQDQWISYEYDGVGNVIRETRSNGVESAYAYDANRRTIELSHGRSGRPFTQVRTTRNALGDITGEEGAQVVPTELVEEGLATTYNELDQVQSRGQDRYAYDTDGNLIAISGGKWQAGYDAENHLAQVNRNGQATKYLYNGLGQRTQSVTGAITHNYHSDLKGRLLFETDGSGQVTRYYIYAGGLLAASFSPGGQSSFYHFNHQGSTLAVTDATGEIAAAYAYTPFGNLVGQRGALRDNPFTFIGAYGVMDEGGGLFYMKNRTYDANSGRFLQKDPLGLSAGPNLYTYGSNNPFNRIDPLGLLDDNEHQIAGNKPEMHFRPGTELNDWKGTDKDWKKKFEPEVLPPSYTAVGTYVANLVIGGYLVVSTVCAVTGSGAIIPAAVAAVGLVAAATRLESTLRRNDNPDDYGHFYTWSDSILDFLDPTKKIRSFLMQEGIPSKGIGGVPPRSCLTPFYPK